MNPRMRGMTQLLITILIQHMPMSPVLSTPLQMKYALPVQRHIVAVWQQSSKGGHTNQPTVLY